MVVARSLYCGGVAFYFFNTQLQHGCTIFLPLQNSCKFFSFPSGDQFTEFKHYFKNIFFFNEDNSHAITFTLTVYRSV